MRKILLILLPLAVMAIGGCIHDEILNTDEAIDSGGSSSTTLTDPGLAWSAGTYTAYMGGGNTFPTLTNTYGVPVGYSSSKESVATIGTDGSISLVSAGETTIFASYAGDDTYDEDSAYYTLTVVLSEGGLSWSAESASVVIGESSHSYPTLSNPNGLEVTYSSSEESVATIDEDGVITLISDGTTIITAAFAGNNTYEQGSASYALTVTKDTDGISWSAGTCTVTIGASNNTFPTLNNPGEQSITYSSSSTGVATIDGDGTVTLVSAGETTITAKSEAKSTDAIDYEAATVSYSLTVKEEGNGLVSAGLAWPATSYTVSMAEGFPSPTLTNPHNLDITYASSDTDVATISSSGEVTVVATGTTTITATSEKTDTYLPGSAYYTLTVTLADSGLAWSSSYCSATFGGDNSFPTLANSNGLDVTFSSSDEGVATVDGEGNPTLVASGTTYIKAYFAGNGTYAETTATYTLKVTKGTPTLTWSSSSYSADIEASSWDFPTLATSPEGLEVTYSSSKSGVATVDGSTGVPSLVATGTTVIMATSAATDRYKSATASYTLTVTSSADTGAGTYTYSSSGDTSSEDDISNTTFGRKITVTYSGSGATVEGYTSDFAVTVNSNQVTITNNGTENVVYYLTGTAGDGFFKLYSSKKQVLHLYNLTLTNSSGAAINNQSGKRTFVYVEGTNTLADGSSAAYSTSSEDMKAVFFSEGQLVFSGSGSLNVTANNSQEKSCIASDDYVRIMDSPAITVSTLGSAGHGIRGKEYVQLSGGTTSITSSAAKKKGITSEDYVLVEGGTHTIKVTGKVAYDSEDGEYKGTAGIKADNYFAMTGGTVTITNSGAGGKGIRAGSDDYNDTGVVEDSYISGGTLTITTTGSESNDVSCKGIKIGWATGSENNVTAKDGGLNVSGGIIKVSSANSEGIEAKDAFTMTGGEVYVTSTGDDAVNCGGEMKISGGYIYANSSKNDALDANGNLTLSGGYVFAVTTAGGAEVAIDCAEQKTLTIGSGVTMVAYPSIESGAALSQSCYTMICTAGSWNALHNGNSHIAAFKAPGGISSVVVSAPSLKSGYKGVSVGGTTYCNGIWATSSISGGSSVSLGSYSGGGNQGGGGNPGGGGGPGGGGRPGGH